MKTQDSGTGNFQKKHITHLALLGWGRSGPSEIDVSAVITLFFLIHLKCLSSSQTGTLNYETKTQILI